MWNTGGRCGLREGFCEDSCQVDVESWVEAAHGNARRRRGSLAKHDRGRYSDYCTVLRYFVGTPN